MTMVTPAVQAGTSEPRVPNTPPRGGSDLILANLQAALPELTRKVQIIVSRPLNATLEERPRILWLQDRPQDPESAPLRDAVFRAQFNALVFVSHWQQHAFRDMLGVPCAEGRVIKNAVPRIDVSLPKPRADKLRFIYTSTPFRGLRVLAAAAAQLATIRRDWELHVYSSMHIYGRHEDDKRFLRLYERLQNTPCVVYHGSVPNAEIRDAVRSAHVFVYPSVFAEMCSMSVIEAMMAGCLTITSNFASLPETCAEWAWMFPYDEREDAMAVRTTEYMLRALERYDDPGVQAELRRQSDYYQRYFAFESRIEPWRALLENVAAQPPAPLLAS